MQVQTTTGSSLNSATAAPPAQSGGDSGQSPFAAILGTQQVISEKPNQSAEPRKEADEQDSATAENTSNENNGALEANPSISAQPCEKAPKAPDDTKSKLVAKPAASSKPEQAAAVAEKAADLSDCAAQQSVLLAMMMAPAMPSPPPPPQAVLQAGKNPIASSENAVVVGGRQHSQGETKLAQPASAAPSALAGAKLPEWMTASRAQESAQQGMLLREVATDTASGASAKASSAAHSSGEQKETVSAAVPVQSKAMEPATPALGIMPAKLSQIPAGTIVAAVAARDTEPSPNKADINENSRKALQADPAAKATAASTTHLATTVQNTKRESGNSSHSGESHKNGDSNQQQVPAGQTSTQAVVTDDGKSAAVKSEAQTAAPQLSQASLSNVAGQQSAPSAHSQASASSHEAVNVLPAQAAGATHLAAAPALSSARLVAHQQYSEVQVNLHSQDLGAVQIRATMRGGQIGAAISAERPEAREALASAMPALHQTLRERDVKVEQITIADRTSTLSDFNSGSGSQSGSAQQQNRQNSMSFAPQNVAGEHEPLVSLEPSHIINESALVDIHA